MTRPAEVPHTMPQASNRFKVMAIYKFAELPDCADIRTALAKLCCGLGIKGTLIVAPEGLNGTVAGTPAAIAELTDFLLRSPRLGSRLAGAEIKYADAEFQPFLRMKVRLKPEIVTLRAPEANPARQVGTYVAPEDWNALIARNDVTILDTRNDYEVRLGSFAGALDPQTQSFTEFKDYVARHLDPARDRKVAMFCTGGIRCEKASAYLLANGFEEVYHLKGGILAYLEQVKPDDSRWRGECFVFDERVTVGHGLASGTAVLCRACRQPVSAEEQRDPRYVEGMSCPHCAGRDIDRTAAGERAHQMQLARRNGLAHLGDEARAAAEARRLEKKARREADRQRALAGR
jgi:UPF0176 protein